MLFNLSSFIAKWRNALLLFFTLVTCASLGLILFPPMHSAVLSNPQKEQGYAWIASVQMEKIERSFWQRLFFRIPHGDIKSSLILKENQQALPNPNTLHERIRLEGAGTFSHWDNYIYFSTLHNDDPIINGKIYSYQVRLQARSRIFLAAFLSIFCFFGCLRRRYTLNDLNDNKRMIICFVVVSACTLFFLSDNISKWEISPDTQSYWWAPSFSDPWNSSRTPGLKMYIMALGQYEATYELMTLSNPVDELTNIAENDKAINSSLKFISNATYFLISISIAILAVALSRHVHLVPAILIPLLFLFLTTLPSPKEILADPFSAILAILFTACGLFFLKSKHLVFLFFASLFAAYAFLVKPAMIVLAVIAGLLILISFIYSYNDTPRRIKIILIGIFLCICTLIWPVNLYRTSGLLVTSQLSYMTNAMFAVYLLQPGDDMLFSDQADKEFVAELLRQKQIVDRELNETNFPNGRSNYSKVKIYTESVNAYGWGLFNQVVRQVRPDAGNNLQELTKLAESVCRPIIRNHFNEYIKIVGRSFVSAFSLYNDFLPSPFSNNNLMRVFQHEWHFRLYIGMLLVILAATLIGKKSLRGSVIFIASIHPLAVLFSSIGHAVLYRYLEITEWSLLLAFMLALWSLLIKIFDKLLFVLRSSSLITKAKGKYSWNNRKL